MKNAVRILTLVLCLLILVPVLFCTVSAAESNLYISYDDASTYLFQLANFHLQKGDEVGAQIYALLNGNSDSYINRMAPLGAAKPESNPEIDLLYHQGKAVAHLAWFYYSNPDTHEIAIEEGLTEELNVTVQSVYEAQKAIIDGMKYDTEQDADVQKQIFDFFFYNTNPDESATTIDDCYTAMLSAIYKAKILSVKEQGISEALSKKIDSEIIPDIEALTYNGAISDDDFETVYDANTNYEEVLQGAEIFISQYQFWETTQAQVALVLQQLFPDESVDTTARLSTFREKIALATPIYGTNNTATGKIECVSNCNTILKETVVSLLDQYKELPQLQRPECSITYRSAYLELFKQQTINPAFTAAGFSGIPDIASTLNDDFHAAVLRADAKDSLVTDSQTLGLPADSYTAEQLEMRQQIVSDYTKDDSQTTEANDAIFDTCDLESLSAQLERARKRLRLFDSYVDTLNQIKDQVGTTGTSSYNADDLTELTGAAATIRTETDEVLKSSNDPQEDLSSGENRLNQLVLEAKARAFENAHADILDPTQAPTKDDLKQAIEDAALLSPEVVTILQGRTEDDGTTPAPVLTAIGERYKDMIQADIAEALAGEDNADIRRESIATLQAAVENLELTAGDTDLTDLKTLPGAADALLDKAQKIDRVLDHYRDQIDDSVKNDEMVAFCDTAAQNIISGTTTPDDAIITLNRMEAKAKILQSAEGATEIPGVQDVLDAVDTELAKRSDPNEIEAYQAHAIDQITACKTAKAQLDKLLDTVGALEHVTEAQKADWTAAAQEDYNEFLTAVTTAADATAIEAAEQDFAADLLAIAKDAAKEEIASATQKETDTIAGYTYSDEAQKQVYLDLITSEKQATLTAIDQSTTDTQDKVFEELTELLDKLSQIAAQADEEEREACVVSAEKELEQSYIPSDYSTERQNELLGIVHEYSKQLDEENAVAETEALLAEALTKIDAIPNLLEEAQAAAEARLRAAYEELMLREHCYSAENLAKLSDFYQRTLIELKQFTAVADTAAATALADERITLMRNIPLDRIYTPDGLLASQETVTVPDGYDPSANGYSGKIEATNGLSATATVTVTPADSTSVAEKIKEAAKDKRIFLSDGSRVSKDLLSLLKNCHVTSALRIELGGTPLAATEHYTVSILLPEGTDLSRVIGVVYLNEDGSAEYMEITSEATLIQFITTHFSDFYLVSENTVNLLPWIVLLCVIILCEALALVLLSLKKSKREKQATLNSLTILPAITALTIYRPAGGVWILSILIVIAVALAVWLTWLILSLRRKPQAETEPIAEETVDIPTEPEPEPEPIPEVEELTHPDPLSTVTAEEAEDLMSDIEAKEELAEETAGYEDPERYSGTKKAEINIDTISEHFESGDTVTLNSLKAKRLIPNSAGAVKILARGFLDKPLTIVAQDFSTAALKMILLTGGTPIVTHASPERGGKRKVTK